MSSTILDLAIRRSRRRHGPLPAGTRPAAEALWKHLTTGSVAVCAPMAMMRVPSMDRVADGAVALARLQAERGIRTIAGRTLAGGGGR